MISAFFRPRLLQALGLAFLMGSTSAYATTDRGVGGLRIPGLFAPACQAIEYEPASVYDAPGGLRIGALVLDHPEYARESSAACVGSPVVGLQAEGRNSLVEVFQTAVGPDEPGLTVYQTTNFSGVTWVQGRTTTGAFWLPVSRARQYLSLERDLVQGLARFSEICENKNRCQPTSETFMRSVQAAGEERPNARFNNAYNIISRVTLSDGRGAYQVQLDRSLVPKFGKQLPLEALVPAVDYRGEVTGAFY
jgi:hypothetical protein